MVIAYIDGSITPNPGGTMGAGVYMLINGKVETHARCWDAKQNNTNNLAEYLALKELLQIFPALEQDELIIYSDSELLVSQMNKFNKINKGKYRATALDCLDLLKEIKKYAKVKISWIPRHKNKKADELSKYRK